MIEIEYPLTKSELQEILSISERTLERWIKADKIPAPKVLGPSRVYWSRAVIKAWLEERLGTPETELKKSRRRGRPRNTPNS